MSIQEKTEITNLPIKIPKGNEAIFCLALTVDKDGNASISYNFQSNVNVAKVATALEGFAKRLAASNADA